jgi:RNA repair pathway DNA polymerase beta family
VSATVETPSFPASMYIDHPVLQSSTSILLAYRGSIAHGTYEPNSEPGSIDDMDAMGICVPDLEHYFALRQFGSRGTVEVIDDPWDIVLYEARKAIGLLAKANPNVLSLLWLPDDLYVYVEPAGQRLIEARDLFATKAAFKPLIGYAQSQLKRLDSSEGKPLKELAYLAGILDGEGHISIDRTEGAKPTHAPIHFLQVGITNTDRDLIDNLSTLYGGHVGRTGIRDGHRKDCYRWRLTGPPAAKFLRELHPFLRIKRRQAEIAIEFAHEMATRQRGHGLTEHELDRREELRQALKGARDDKRVPVPEPERAAVDGPERYSLAYMGEKRRALVEQHGYDTKNAAHTIRILRMGIEFLRTGELQVRRPDADELLEIKHGEWSLEQIKNTADFLFAVAEEAHAASPLPEAPDRDAINRLCAAVVAEALGSLAVTPPQPTGATLKQLQQGSLRTRLDSSPRKHRDEGYGWDRPCATSRCPTILHHLHEGEYCYACSDRRSREEVQAA